MAPLLPVQPVVVQAVNGGDTAPDALQPEPKRKRGRPRKSLAVAEQSA